VVSSDPAKAKVGVTVKNEADVPAMIVKLRAALKEAGKGVHGESEPDPEKKG